MIIQVEPYNQKIMDPKTLIKIDKESIIFSYIYYLNLQSATNFK